MPGPTLSLTRAHLGDLLAAGADALALPVRGGGEKPRAGVGAAEVAELCGLSLPAVLEQEKAKGEPGEAISIPVTPADSSVARLVLVGVGDESPPALRRAGAALARRVTGRRVLATTVATRVSAEAVRAFAEGLILASYSFHRRSEPAKTQPVGRVEIVVERPEASKEALDRGRITAEATWFARDLASTPSNEKSPEWLAEQAKATAAAGGLELRVRDEARLAEEGFHGILAVGAGSSRPPRLIELSYGPADLDTGTPHVVLVGKGITFDSGGLSIKPRDAMIPMKTDMTGGGVVIAAMGALRALGVAVRVTGLVPAAENLPSGSAVRPGDVIKHFGGRTVEVLNTDAEGRLVLADALAYADAELEPDAIVDLATLTGAATLGLGRRHAALYSTEDRLADALIAAGATGGERLWRMPLVDDYRSALDSAVADLRNIERGDAFGAGSIIAALFLREFAGRRPWAHLDIAGPARADTDEHEVTKGPTGFGTRTLLRWLESPHPVRVGSRRP